MSYQPFLDTYQCVKTFYSRPENELSIAQLGYHDFHRLKACRHMRKQDFWTLHIVLSGKGTLNFNKSSHCLGENDIFVLPPDQWFSYFPDNEDPWSYIFFVVKGSLAKDYFNSAGFDDNNPLKYVANTKKILSGFTNFFEKVKNNIPVSYFETTSLFYLALNHTLTKDSELLSVNIVDIVEEAMSIIRFRFTDPDLSISSIADQLHISHTQLSHLFKKRTGMTMISYLNEQRMNYAEELFRTTQLKASEIALITGFNEYNYFLNKFKQKHNMTTGEYRAHLKK